MPVDPGDIDVARFRLRAREWLAEHAPARFEATEDQPEYWHEARRFQGLQHAAGFGGIDWPQAYGGQGLTRAHQVAFNEEAAGYELPSVGCQITLAIVGMTLLDHGTEEQKRRYLPAMLRGEHVWVQLLSEPSAGSDLAALRTAARRAGGGWVLSGEKVWSSFAQWSDNALVLARSDWGVPKHAGLTAYVVPLDTPGVTVSPLRQLTGDAEFCQVFLDEVSVPLEARVGQENDGWAVATSMFAHSRAMTGGAALTGPVFQKNRGGEADPGRDLIDYVNGAGRGSDAAVRKLIADVVVDNIVAGLLATRVTGDPDASPVAGTMAKMFGAEALQRRRQAELVLRGEEAVAWPEAADAEAARCAFRYLRDRTATVAGGTTEVMRNVIAEAVLGLPRDTPPDKNKPFRETVGLQAGQNPART
jgi:alkylation response protein AidB-like acyl-CoA dehydrogenase